MPPVVVRRHSRREKLHLRHQKRKTGPSAMRRKERRAALQPTPLIVFENVSVTDALDKVAKTIESQRLSDIDQRIAEEAQ